MKTMALLVGTVLLTTHAMAATPAESLKQLIAEEWEFDMREDPLFATQTGDHRYNDKLPSVTVADEERREKAVRDFLKRLETIDRKQLSGTDGLNYDLFARTLRDRLGEYEFKTYLMPITNREGFHTDFPQLPDRVPLNNTTDYENYCARLEACNTYFTQYIGVMRAGAKAGYLLPKVVMEGWETAVDAHIVKDPAKSLLYAPFTKFPDDVPAA